MVKGLIHPTPVHIELAIMQAMARWDEANPRDRFPLCARSVLRSAIREAVRQHEQEQAE